MAKFAHVDVLEQGPQFIKDNCDKLALISSYAVDDSYAVVNGRILAEAAMVSGDFVFSASGLSRVLTSAAGKTDAAANASGGGATNHLAFLDTANSKVLWVTNETTGQVITSGNPVQFPSLTYTASQPV